MEEVMVKTGEAEEEIRRMERSNLDRVLAGALTFINLLMGILGNMTGEGDRAALAVAFYLLLLASCIRYNPTGWWAQYKWFGDRIQYYVDEGIYIVPWFLGFSSLAADCRDKPHKFKCVTAFTMDNVEVNLKEILIVTRIFHLGRYHQLDSTELRTLLNDIIDRDVLRKVKEEEGGVREVIKMVLSAKKTEGGIEAGKALRRWGMEVIEIVVPEAPLPTDPKVKAAIQIATAEKMEAEGDTVEIRNVIARVAELMKGGWTQEQAIERVDITTKGTTKQVNVQKIMADPVVLATLAALLGRKG